MVVLELQVPLQEHLSQGQEAELVVVCMLDQPEVPVVVVVQFMEVMEEQEQQIQALVVEVLMVHIQVVLEVQV
jgi:hypothetical protein